MRTASVIVFLLGCSRAEPTTATTKDAESPSEPSTPDPTIDTDTDTPSTEPETTPTGDTGSVTTPACDPMNSGLDWAWNGACPQMLTPCEIQVTDCALTIDYSSGMSMGMPTGALVSGAEVTFNAAGSVNGCVGTLLDADSIEGTCAGGCSFTLRR